jgi:hypothetical protein
VAVQGRCEIRTGDGNGRLPGELHLGTLQRDLKTGSSVRIADDAIPDSQGDSVHGSAQGDSVTLMAMAAQVLDRREESRSVNEEAGTIRH